MSEKEKETVVIKEVKFAGTIEISHETLNSTIDEWEKVKKGFKEMPHPDLREAFDDVAQQIMQILGFPNMHPKWGKYKCKSVKFEANNKVSATVVFNHATHNMVSVDLPDTTEIPFEVVQSAIDEVKAFVTGKKRGQGELFNFEVDPAQYDEPQLAESEEVNQPLLSE